MQIPFLLDAPLDLILAWLNHRPQDARDLRAVAGAVRDHFGGLPTTAPAYGLCHGDLHKSNDLDDGDGRLTVLDWDCLGYGWRAYDLAVLRWSIGPAVGPDGIGEPRMTAVWATGVEIEGAERGRFGLALLTERFWDNRMAKLRSCPYGQP